MPVLEKSYLLVIVVTMSLISCELLSMDVSSTLPSITSEKGIVDIEWTPCGEKLCIAEKDSPVLRLYQAESMGLVKSISCLGPIIKIKSSISNNMIALGLVNGRVELVDAATSQLSGEPLMLAGSTIRSMAWLEGTPYLLVYAKDNRVGKDSSVLPSESLISLCNMAKKEVSREFTRPFHIIDLQVSQGGNGIALAMDLVNKKTTYLPTESIDETPPSQRIELYGMGQNASEPVLMGTHNVNVPIKAMAWSSQNLLAVLLDSGSVQILNIQGRVIKQLFVPGLERACGSMDWTRTHRLYIPCNLNKVFGCTPGSEEAVEEVINLDQFYSTPSKYLVANLLKSSAKRALLAISSHDMMERLGTDSHVSIVAVAAVNSNLQTLINSLG